MLLVVGILNLYHCYWSSLNFYSGNKHGRNVGYTHNMSASIFHLLGLCINCHYTKMIWLQFCDAQYALDNIVYMMTSWKPGDPDFECIKANFMYLMDGIASIPFMWLRGRYYRAIKVPSSTFTINLLCPDLQVANLMRILFSNLFMISLG